MRTYRSTKKVIHVLPSDDIGGAEIAAHSLHSGEHGDLTFQKYFLVSGRLRSANPHDSYGPAVSLNHALAYFAAVRHILRTKPDLLIASLWRSVLVMIACKLLRPSMQTVIFLHSAGTAHRLDWAVNRVGIALANEVWVDSTATLSARCKGRSREKSRVISFLLDRRVAPPCNDIKPNFIFWGRLRTPKNLRRAIDLFQRIVALDDRARFTIIGPDGGEEALVKSRIQDLGLGDHVTLRGPLGHDDIAKAAASSHFYLQTSTHEGMAMSVVEAMQLGLIPVVTPVGEIGNYCTDGLNSIIIHDDVTTVETLRELLSVPERAHQMSQSAVDTWTKVPFYRDEVLMGSRRILGLNTSHTR